MKNIFKNITRSKTAAEKLLDELEVEYELRDDGTIFVPGDLVIGNR